MPPERKKARNDESGDPSVISNDDSSSGFIRFEVDIVNLSAVGVYAPEIEVMGIPWKLFLKKNHGRSTTLAVHLCHPYSESNIWSISVAAEFRLISTVEGTKSYSRTFNIKYSHEQFRWGFPEFYPWMDLIDDGKGFTKNNKITVEVQFKLSNFVGISPFPCVDFSDGSDPCHDVALIINGARIYASKHILAVHSPVFKAMFFGEFIEANQKEIELKDVDRKEFIELLKLIYPSYQKITDDNAGSLLKIADRFQIPTVINQIEQFLIVSSKMNMAAKLKISDQYRLVKLQDHCLGSLKTVKEITDLKTHNDFKSLSHAVQATLLQKLFKLIPASS